MPVTDHSSHPRKQHFKMQVTRFRRQFGNSPGTPALGFCWAAFKLDSRRHRHIPGTGLKGVLHSSPRVRLGCVTFPCSSSAGLAMGALLRLILNSSLSLVLFPLTEVRIPLLLHSAFLGSGFRVSHVPGVWIVSDTVTVRLSEMFLKVWQKGC